MISINTLADTIRILSADAIKKANSGHPGMPLGMADIATVLWQEFLQHNPSNPKWINRDRFVLSNGHGSMLLYSLLHLTGYDLSIDDIKNFRQLHSKTPGHPEAHLTPGVETTTGPLGQGLANAVGMALAEKILAAQFNKRKHKIIDHYTYAFVGDGCLMEGISHEVASLAGTWALGKLIVFWDNNNISIDGHTDPWFTENIPLRFQSYKWHVIANVNGHNFDSIRNAIKTARINDRPTLICCNTTIGRGAPTVCNTAACHGSPLDDKEITAMRNTLDWHYPPFEIPDDIYSAWNAKEKGQQAEELWQALFNDYQTQYSDLAAELLRRINGDLPRTWASEIQKHLGQITTTTENIATRKASQQALSAYGPILPELLGGAADLTPSVLTNWPGSKDITNTNFDGNYIHYGVREFGMFAIMNGCSLHGGFIPYGGTFFAFVSYGHSAIRMAAMMKLRVIFVLTHDSIGLGEDGPTHQPIEQLAMLRATPNLSVWRPCDQVETAIAWQYAIENKNEPTALVLSRQKLPAQKRDANAINNIRRGGYILVDTDSTPEYILIASGSEVALAVTVATKLKEQGKNIRVVSMPSQDVFDKQDEQYKTRVLPTNISKRIAIEAAASQSWYKYVGTQGKIIGIDRFGESAPDKILFEFFGFSEQNVENLISSY